VLPSGLPEGLIVLGFVGTLERYEPWVNNIGSREESFIKPTNGFIVMLRGTRED
jgi:hypothetical protein